jgi:methionyl-tRNA formyltransferase
MERGPQPSNQDYASIAMKKKIVFIGNRAQVLDVCLSEPDWEVGGVFAHRGSYLAKDLAARGLAHAPFAFADKEDVLRQLEAADYDILVSNGCPFILPIARLSRQDRLFINTHPSVLPDLKGSHPINGLFLQSRGEFGATTHYMAEEVDAGEILAQLRVPLTPDLDAGLVYRLSFQLEAEAFRQAVAVLKAAGYHRSGRPQEAGGSTYRRTAADQSADASLEPALEIEKKIRAFGIRTLGTTLNTRDGAFRVFEGCAVTHEEAKKRFGRGAPGAVVLEYDGKLLVETPDGLVKLVVYEKLGGSPV